jgi:uncharacterized protein (DUF433 family)
MSAKARQEPSKETLLVSGRDNVIRVFGEEHVERLTGLSKRQLRAWDRRGFFVPHYAYENRRSPYSRVYSFRDVVGLRTIAVLLKEHRVSIRQLMRVAKELSSRGYRDWAQLRLYVVKREVHFQDPTSKAVESVWSGQLAMLPIIDVINDVTERADMLQRRTKEQHGQIERHRFVVRNSPVVAGTRIPTATIRRFHEAGYSADQILEEYPSLTLEDVKAALKFEEGLAHSA